jgi:hypothetical protein
MFDNTSLTKRSRILFNICVRVRVWRNKMAFRANADNGATRV